MPVAADGAAVELRVEADRAVVLTATAGGRDLPVRRETGDPASGILVGGVPVERGAVRCELAGTDGPWRLRRVSAVAHR